MHKITYIFIVLFLIFSACNKDRKVFTKAGEKMVTTKLATYKVFKHEKGQYKIIIPENWEFKKKKGNAMAASVPYDANDEFRESIDVLMVKNSFTQNNAKISTEDFVLDNFSTEYFNSLLQNDIYKLIKEGEGKKTINNVDSRWMTFTDKTNSKDLRVMKYILTKDNQAYLITGACNHNDFITFGPLFNEMVESFEIL